MKRKISILSIIFGTFFFLTGCGENGTTEKRTGRFFDDCILNEYSLSFLEKPKIVTKEREYIYKETYIYQAIVPSLADFENYAQNVYAKMIGLISYMGTTKPYAGANSVDNNDESFYLLYENEPMEAYKSTVTVEKAYGYLFYYSDNEKLGEYEDEKGGRKLTAAARLSVTVEIEKQNGIETVWLSLAVRHESNVYLFGK